jgi:hypothetical protein
MIIRLQMYPRQNEGAARRQKSRGAVQKREREGTAREEEERAVACSLNYRAQGKQSPHLIEGGRGAWDTGNVSELSIILS